MEGEIAYKKECRFSIFLLWLQSVQILHINTAAKVRKNFYLATTIYVDTHPFSAIHMFILVKIPICGDKFVY